MGKGLMGELNQDKFHGEGVSSFLCFHNIHILSNYFTE